MTTTTLIVLNALLAVAIVGGLAAVVRLALRLSDRRGESLHFSEPLTLDVALAHGAPAVDEEPRLARAA